ncbi:hypothetical protein BH23BAC4_BH23BAC4_05610 [soil metagenome]
MTSRLSSSLTVAFVVAALLATVACRDGVPDPPEDSALVGTWVLDAETREWLPRACVVLDFEDPTFATFVASVQDEDLVVNLRDTRRTTWRGPVRGERFEAQQLLPTSPTGRFCGSETVVRLHLQIRNNEFRGVWETPNCDVCPDRHFGAQRLDSGVGRTVPAHGR